MSFTCVYMWNYQLKQEKAQNNLTFKAVKPTPPLGVSIAATNVQLSVVGS